MTDSARSETGAWRIDRWLLATAAVVLGIGVLGVFPLRVTPAFVHDDALLHFVSGVSLTLAFAATVPRRDDLLAALVATTGVLWEPVEWWFFACWRPGTCTTGDLAAWLTAEDTLLDVALVALGAAVALRAIGRWR